MKRLKSNDHTLDRLSALPDSLIHEILSFLGMRDVVRTHLLSKRWKYLWTTVPCLNFIVYRGKSVHDRNFVSRALTRWRGTCLRKFRIIFDSCDAALLTSDLDLWVLFANERKVEELCIEFLSGGLRYCPPQCLYECSSIRKLSLRRCDLQICGSVKWNRLNTLELFECDFSEDVMNQVFSSSSSSPQLETFGSYFNRGFHNLSIRSSSLKKLSITTNSDEDDLLTICAPKVEALYIRGRPFSKCLLTDISSLTDVDLDFWYLEACDAMCQIFPAIQHVTTVRLSKVCLKLLGDLRGKYSFQPLLNVKVLRIGSGGVTELSVLLHLFDVFPKVKMLIIDWEYNPMRVEEQFNAENYKMSEASILESNLLQLKTVEITFYSCCYSSMLQFIEFLLKHATVIEKIVLQTRRYGQLFKSEDVLQVARQLLSLQRSFPSVEMIL